MHYKIKNIKVLNTINNKLERNIFIEEIESDLQDLSKSKNLHLGNIQNLMNYLVFSQESNRHYYEGLVYLLENTNVDKFAAIAIIDEIMGEDEFLYVEILRYFAPEVMNKKDGEVQ